MAAVSTVPAVAAIVVIAAAVALMAPVRRTVMTSAAVHDGNTVVAVDGAVITIVSSEDSLGIDGTPAGSVTTTVSITRVGVAV